MVFLLISIGVVISIVGDLLLKQSKSSNPWLIMGGVLLYGLAAFPVAKVLQKTEFSLVFLYWEIVVIILGVAIGYLFYHEPLTIYKIIAVILVVIACALIYK